MLKSFWNMRYKEPGFAPQQMLASTMDLGALRDRDKNAEFTFIDRLLQRTSALPGIEAVALTTASETPPGEGSARNNAQIEGRPLTRNSRHKASMKPQEVSSAHFKLLQIPLLDSRLLRDSDRSDSLPVAVVNNQFARRHSRMTMHWDTGCELARWNPLVHDRRHCRRRQNIRPDRGTRGSGLYAVSPEGEAA